MRKHAPGEDCAQKYARHAFLNHQKRILQLPNILKNVSFADNVYVYVLQIQLSTVDLLRDAHPTGLDGSVTLQ